MSVWSSWNYECTFPIGTRLNPDSEKFYDVCKVGDRVSVAVDDGMNSRVEDFLFDLVVLFDKPMDEVPGLELNAWYRYEEDEYDEVRIEIKDGEVKCEQTVKTWEPCTLAEAGIRI